GHRPVPLPRARRVRGADPAGGEADGGAVRRRRARVGLYLLVLAFVLFAAFPFLWGTITAFKQNPDLYTPSTDPFLFNKPPTLSNITLLLFHTPFRTFVVNTVVVGVLVVLITLIISLPAAY